MNPLKLNSIPLTEPSNQLLMETNMNVLKDYIKLSKKSKLIKIMPELILTLKKKLLK